MTQTFSHNHLLGIEDLSKADIVTILDLAQRYAAQNRSSQKKCNKLAGKTVVNLFFEPSTRTRVSFEIAAKRLGADVINFKTEASSVRKGETFLDTVHTIEAMQVDAFVIRHKENGMPHTIASQVEAAVLNAGDGTREHPTQALLDALTMRKCKGKLEGLTVAICGDIEHSRVARSNVSLLKKFGASVRLFAPPMFTPKDASSLGVPVFDDLTTAIKAADVVMMLRIQRERFGDDEFAMSVEEYHSLYGLDHDKLKAAKKDVIVMHPAPVNRGVEITSELMDDPQYSVIFEQIEYGVAVRMACLDLLVGAQ